MAKQNTLLIYNLEDTHLEDEVLLTDYYSQFLAGNYMNAFDLLRNTPRLKTRVITSDNMNLLINAVIGAEDLYDTDVNKKMNALEQEFQLNIDELRFMRDWSADDSYQKFNFVIYDGDLYFCIEDSPTGTLPTDTAHWKNLGLQGDTGEIGLGMYFVGVYNEQRSYNRYEVVSVGGKSFYLSMEDGNIGNEPMASPDKWSKVFEMKASKYIISPTPPQKLEEGRVWFKLVDE